MADDRVTYVRISSETESRLDDRREEGASYDDVIAALLDETDGSGGRTDGVEPDDDDGSGERRQQGAGER